MNEYQLLTEVLEMSLSLDKKAYATYYKFYKATQNTELKNEWLKRAEEEKVHIIFWEKALALSKKKHLPLIFKNPLATRDKVKKTYDSIQSLLQDFNGYDVYIEQMTLAFILEAYMLHPVFMEIFHTYDFIYEKIEEQYEKHILSFIDMIRNFHGGLGIIHVKLFCENLHDLYSATKEHLETAMRDPLTGLYNRGGFVNTTKPLLNLADREKNDAGIVLLDFDDFKQINDSRGHAAGDTALKAGVTILNSCIRESDIAARYGGDEFIVFTLVKNSNSLEKICKRIIEKTMKQSISRAGFPFTVSIGAAKGKITKPYEENLALIINNADKKLYEAKTKGKGGWAL
jgi:diguanylate cyclase (GGDEF)-like protein